MSSDKEKIKKEIKTVINALIKGCETLDMNILLFQENRIAWPVDSSRNQNEGSIPVICKLVIHQIQFLEILYSRIQRIASENLTGTEYAFQVRSSD
jgi:hypothetical protein